MAKDKLEIKSLPNKELVERYKEERTMFQKLKFSDAVAKIENPGKIKESRKNIARYLTELNARRIERDMAKLNQQEN